jgi:hypothetical protein
MNLKYKEFQSILSSANTSYKFLLFYSLINILKKDPKISEITYKELLKNILKLAWFPCFQFSLKFRDQDRIKSVLDKLTKSVNLDLKIKQPNNKIIKKIEEEIDALLSVEENYEMVDSLLLKYVLDRLIRPFYPSLKNVPESGENSISKKKIEIFRNKNEFIRNKPIYFNLEKEKKIILDKDWRDYIVLNYVFLEPWVISEWENYMKLHNPSVENLKDKLKIPTINREALTRSRNFWDKIIFEDQIKCIFSKQILNKNNYHIDHYICWNFLAHDDEWNLIPILSSKNLDKSNKIPKEIYLKEFVNLKYLSLNISSSVSKNRFNTYVDSHINFVGEKLENVNNFKKIYQEKMTSLSTNAILNGYQYWNN